MGSFTEYTLCFKGINDYGHVFMLPIISMSLKDIDKYTSNYSNSLSMFKCLPNVLKDYIKKIVNKKTEVEDDNYLKKCFVIKKDNTYFDVIYRKDVDVTYITPKELKEEIKSVMMNKMEFQKSLLSGYDDLKARYHFFEYLYKKYLEEKEVINMMDTYDAKVMFPSLSGDKLMIAALATDNDNLTILLKKIGQTDTGKRDVAIKYKELYRKIKGDFYLPKEEIEKRFNEGLDISKMKKNILNNLTEFKSKYEKEYM